MKHTLFLVMLFFLTFVLRANTYYFSSSTGDDSYSDTAAQNENTPWKSLDKLNSIFNILNPGDSVLFKRGELFNGSILAAKSGSPGFPIIISAYGSGEKPVISGFVTLSQWINSGNGIWETSCSSCDSNMNLLLVNGQAREPGRYPNSNDPNKGYLGFENHSGTHSITDLEMQPGVDWTGGEVVIRKKRWVIDKNQVTEHIGNTLTYLSNPKSYEPEDNFGYFIQRHPLTLDKDGEWYFDKTNKMILLYMGSTDPQNYKLEAGVINTLVSLKNQNDIVFDNLAFSGANVNAFEIIDAINISIQNCSITFSGTNAITASGTNQLTIRNLQIMHTYNNAIVLGADCANSLVSDNKISDTGLFPGMGKNGDETYQAIIIKGSANTIASNEIENTGYIPIRFEGNDIVVTNNYINNFDLVKDDGGGIYTYTGTDTMTAAYKRTIKDNIILNGRGSGEGTNNLVGMNAAGIYIDDNADHVEISGNTVASCRSGIYMHNAYNIAIKANTLYNNDQQLLLVQDHKAVNSLIRNLDVSGNIFFCKQAPELAISMESMQDDLQQFGTLDSNYFCSPFSNNFYIYTSYQENDLNISNTHNLKSWQQAFGQDINSVEPVLTRPSYSLNNLIGDNKFENSKFDNMLTGVSDHSPGNNCSITWNSGVALDEGSLTVTCNDTPEEKISLVIFSIGDLDSGKNYILRFSLLGSSTNRRLKIFLRNSLEPFNKISEDNYVVITEGRTENELLLSASGTVSNGCIVFEWENANDAFGLDNLNLHEADISFTDLDNYIRFEYNATNSEKHIILTDSYKDVKGNIFKDELLLPPYTSIILLKQTDTLLSTDNLEFTVTTTEKDTELKWITQTDDTLNYFEVERSSNGIDFTSAVKINFTGADNYAFVEKRILTGKNFYRLKQVAKTGKYVYSKIVLVENRQALQLQLGPNPVNHSLKVYYQPLKQTRRANLIIQNPLGITLRNTTVELFNQPLKVDVSALSPGLYYLKIISAIHSGNKTFIKQ